MPKKTVSPMVQEALNFLKSELRKAIRNDDWDKVDDLLDVKTPRTKLVKLSSIIKSPDRAFGPKASCPSGCRRTWSRGRQAWIYLNAAGDPCATCKGKGQV